MEVAILTAGFVLVGVLCVIQSALSNRGTNKLLRSLVQFDGNQRIDTNHLLETILEKLMTDPQWSARLHANVRLQQDGMRASLEREQIRSDGKPIQPAHRPADWHPDGVNTTNLDEARN